jgi:hypothetical protein
MSKQKIQKELHERQMHQAVTRLGAWALTALAVVGVHEMITHNAHSVSQSIHSTVSLSEMMSRGEGKTETARLPEEFDIGLQTPPVSGV